MDKGYQAQLDEWLDGPLVGRFDVKGGTKELLDGGLIDRFISAVKPFVSQEPDEINEGFRRDRIWYYAIEAVRETVLNALAHRDWTRSV
ncbi:hypothetical protein RZS08_40895, partial [Arthrospira platensis SPKY1]|nr:hypothetical protein [Arthrospira platensis SPKY1]